MLVLPARVRVGVTSGGAVMADEETGMLVDTVRQEAHAIVRGGGEGLARAARAAAVMRRFSAWNALLACRARHGIPGLVFGWAQWEAMGRFPVSAEARIALLSPVRRPVSRGADGVRRHVPLPGPEPSDGRARWMRAGWVAVSAFDAPDTEGRPLESMFPKIPVPRRDEVFDMLGGMLGGLGMGVLVVPGDPKVRLSARSGPGPDPVVSYDPGLADPMMLAHLVAHLAVNGGTDERSRAWTLTVMLCSMLDAPAPDVVPLPERMGVVDVLESCRMRLVRLESYAPGRRRTGSGRGSLRMALPSPNATGSRMAPPGGAPRIDWWDGLGELVFDAPCPVCGRNR